MRTNKPQTYDRTREYKPGERCEYNGQLLIAQIYTKTMRSLNVENPVIFPSRCIMCHIERSDCDILTNKCDHYGRSDRKDIFFKPCYSTQKQVL